MTTFSIRAKAITKSYRAQSVLKNIDLEVKRGSIFAVLGPNGAGKTTMVRILSTLTKATSGSATIADHDLTDVNAIRSKISLTGQYAAVDEKLTGRENMLMIGELCGINKKEVQQKTRELLDQFELTDSADKISSTYSGGMRRKLDLAMSLISSPEIIFLDEPTTGLDPRSRQAMWGIINKLRANGVTIFLTTQYLEEADQLADMIAVIDQGVVVASGTPDDLKQRIGERSLRLTFTSQTAAQTVAKLFDRNNILSNDGATLSLKTDGGLEQTRLVIDTLLSADVQPIDMTFHSPSLDEVFFALTGTNQNNEDTSDEK